MKNILKTILLTSLIFTYTIPTFAQEEEIEQDVQEVVEDELENTEEVEEKESLLEKLTTEEITVEYESPSFITVLGTILIPSIFIIICYLILKFFKTK
jgi:hypothetical protein